MIIQFFLHVHFKFIAQKSFKPAHITELLYLFIKQVDRGTDERVVKIALVKSSLAREDLPEDLSDIVFPVSANYTYFHVKSSLSILRTNGGSTFLALLWDLHSGASLQGCVVRMAGWMHLG